MYYTVHTRCQPHIVDHFHMIMTSAILKTYLKLPPPLRMVLYSSNINHLKLQDAFLDVRNKFPKSISSSLQRWSFHIRKRVLRNGTSIMESIIHISRSQSTCKLPTRNLRRPSQTNFLHQVHRMGSCSSQSSCSPQLQLCKLLRRNGLNLHRKYYSI